MGGPVLVIDTLQIEQVGAKSSQPHLESSVLPVSRASQQSVKTNFYKLMKLWTDKFTQVYVLKITLIDVPTFRDVT